jgi:hypothetical protein
MPSKQLSLKQQRCLQLLEDYKIQYQKYQQQLQDWQQEQERILPPTKEESLKGKDCKQRAFDDFQSSQFVEFQDVPYNCLQNKCSLNCNTAASAEHVKCKCQALYLNGRSHLNAPCDPNSGLTGSELTREQCEQLGYLDNNGLEYELFRSNDPTAAPQTLLSEQPNSTTASTKPVLIFPTITCQACAPEFMRLQQDFSYDNIVAVKECVMNLRQTRVASMSSCSSASSSYASNHSANGNRNKGRQRVLPSKHESSVSEDCQGSVLATTQPSQPRKLLLAGAIIALLVLITVLLCLGAWALASSNNNNNNNNACRPCTPSACPLPVAINLTVPPCSPVYQPQ